MSINLIKLHPQYIEHDFKSEYLFRTCSVATNLVTSYHFRSKLYYYVLPFLLAKYGAIPYSLIFHSHSRTATSNATSEYETVPERTSTNEELNIQNL